MLMQALEITYITYKDREWLYKHMGHSEEINQCRYQAPPAIMELAKVAKHLVEIDGKIVRVSNF